MENRPIISIIVPCYNQAQYLSDTLKSVLAQELTEWECIIVNDGSIDNTEEIALKWCKKDNRFSYYNKENGGVCKARNYGIKKSMGKYILPLDADDIISKEYTKEAIVIFENNRDVKIVFSKAMMFGEAEGEWSLLPYSYQNMLFVRNCIHCSGIYRRSDYEKTIGYNPNMNEGWEDYDFWLSILHENDIVIKLEDFHFFYRIKKISRTTEISKDIERKLRLQLFRNHEDIYLKYFNPIEIYNELKLLKNIQNTKQYKIGGIIVKPFRFLYSLFIKKK